MPKLDPYEARIMRDCQRGAARRDGGYTGSVCRKPQLCRDAGRCYFVASVERYREEHPAQAWPMGRRMPPPLDLPRPVFVIAGCTAAEDGRCTPECGRHRPGAAHIAWHAGYDGHVWAL